MSTTLLSLFSEITDPRRRQGQMYPLPTVLLYTVLAIVSGAKSYRQVHGFIDTHLVRLNAAFGLFLRHAPAYTTVRFILRGLDANELERVFRAHAAELSGIVIGDADSPACVAIDGKPCAAASTPSAIKRPPIS